MRAKSVLTTVTVAVFLVLCGVLAQAGFNNAHCGAEFDRVAIGGGTVDAFVLHTLYRDDTTRYPAGEINTIDIEINVPVPNKLPGFATLSNALDSSFTVKFSHVGRAAIYATCDVHPSYALGFSGKLSYAMRITDDDGVVTFHGGVCDIEPWTPGVQAGVPDMHLEDVITTYVNDGDDMVMVSSGHVATY